MLGALSLVVGSGFAFAGWAILSKRARALPGGRPLWAAIGVATTAAVLGFIRVVV